MATWLEINKAFIGNTVERVSERTGNSYRLTFVNLPKGTTIDGHDLSGASLAVFEDQVKIRQSNGIDTDTRLIPIDEDTVTLSVPVRDSEGRAVVKEDGKWLTDRLVVPVIKLRDALRENDRVWREEHPTNEEGRVTIELSKAFVSGPIDRVSREGRPYQRVAVSLPPDVRIGGTDVGQGSFFVFASQVRAQTKSGVDTGLRLVTLADEELELSVPDRDAQGRNIVGEDGRWMRHPVMVSPLDMRTAIEESRTRHRAANRVVTPREVRRATGSVLDSHAGRGIEATGPSLTLGR